MKKIVPVIVLTVLVASLLSGCRIGQKEYTEYTKYEYKFIGAFDTLTQIVGYTKTRDEFDSYAKKIESRFLELHKLYDIYNDYEGINNVKTINDNAGIKPVKVDKQIIDLIKFSKDWYNRTGGKTNIAMGSVLKIWHDYREEAERDPANAKIPPMEELSKASEHIDIDKVIIDEEKSTVYLEDERMSLDVGAAAKGYAVEIVANEIMEEGFVSGIIDGGGNIRVTGKPLDGIREKWGIGIQDPDEPVIFDKTKNLDVVFANNVSIVSSGDYQRNYVVGDKRLHHIIDPETLMPGSYHRAVTIITGDSGVADFLSTTVFLMPYEEGKNLVDSLEGVEAIWAMLDGTLKATDGAKKMMGSRGATGGRVK
ncbi:MAG TPA: FAD:protein FMN transferase [Clostridia bacterium]|nr:FAD:protein FMN transferase [Clostridia bacterium]